MELASPPQPQTPPTPAPGSNPPASPTAAQYSIRTKDRGRAGIAVAIVGIILILLAVGYVVYERYLLHRTYHLLTFHPITYSVGIIGVILLIIGAILSAAGK